MTDEGGAGPAPDLIEVIDNYNGTGRTLLRISWNSWTMQPNDEHDLDFHLEVLPGIANNWYYADLYMTSNDSVIDECDNSSAADSDDLDGDGDTSEILCFNQQSFEVEEISAAGVDAEKWILGNPIYPPIPGGCEIDPEGYTRYPCVALTDPLGPAAYKIVISNSGSIGLKDLTVVDILPHLFDYGVTEVLATTIRGSEWRPELVGDVTEDVLPPGANALVYYSVSTNPCRPEMTTTGEDPWPTAPACDDDWQLRGSPGAPALSDVQAIKWSISFSGEFAPGESLTLGVPMVAGTGSPTGGETAWNSFGYRIARSDTGQLLDPSEPIKVGIQLVPPDNGLGGYTWDDVNGDGIQDGGEALVAGVPVDVYKSDDTWVGSDVSDANGDWFVPLLSSGFSYYAVFDLPLGELFFAPQDQGSDDELDSDPDDFGKTNNYYVGPFDIVDNVDAGIIQPPGLNSCDDPGVILDYSGPRGPRSLPDPLPCPV